MTASQWIAYARKALVAALAGLGQVGLAVAPLSDGGSTITTAEWVAIAMATAGAITVYAVKNGTKPDDPAAE